MKKRVNGLFIVLEGIDGSGKSKISELLAANLKKQRRNILLTHEPWKSKYGKQIRKLVRSKEGKNIRKVEWLKLFDADRQEHINKEILPALRKGKIVLCDRYYYSTLAYQLSAREWKEYSSRIKVKPDIVFIFDLPVSLSLKRASARDKKDGRKTAVFEKRVFLENVRKKFLMIPRVLEDNIKVIDSKTSVKKVFQTVKKEVEKVL